MRKGNPRSLDRLLRPRTLAIVGASRDDKKVGHVVLHNILGAGFRGTVYLVNPEAKSIDQLPCYAKYRDLPEAPDLAIIALPSPATLKILPALAARGTKNIVIFSAGWRETGTAGEQQEIKLKQLAERAKLNILGPNCLGFLNASVNLNATFGRVLMQAGNLRFISQSGAIATALFDYAAANSLGFSEFITLGNKTVIDEVDILTYWQTAGAPHRTMEDLTSEGLAPYQPIGLYLESLERGQEFLQAVKIFSRHHPVFLIKPGRTAAAQTAMQSHTGALAGDEAVLTAALKSAGVIHCRTLEDLFDLSRFASWERAPQGPRVAIISNAGGPAVVATDNLTEAGLTLAPLSGAAKKTLRRWLPAFANVNDPIDLLGDALAKRYQIALQTVAAEPQVDALLVIITPQLMTQIEQTAEVISALSKKWQKPIVGALMGGQEIVAGEQVLNRYKIPSFRFPERALQALGALWWWQKWRQTTAKERRPHLKSLPLLSRAQKIIRQHQRRRLLALSPLAANTLLAATGLATPPSAAVWSGEAAGQWAAKIGYPVVLKLSSSALLHKTEQRAVITNIANQRALTAAWRQLEKKRRSLKQTRETPELFIQRQIQGGIEVIVGVKRDRNFGPVLLFGAGGTWAELIGQSIVHLLPLTIDKAAEMIKQSTVGRLLTGYRGAPASATTELALLMTRLGELALRIPAIKEIEINPVIVTPTRAWAVDIRVILNQT
ncbi:MAG: acetate--CoA ligase family protein [Candidatus Magasanikbacteria bacterium]|nr:acetate--CoA ligase family protein [Candidatus Magasanikbacteria bacterium]